MVGQAALADWDIIVNGAKVSPTGVYLASGLNSGTGAWAAAAGSLGTLTLQAGSPTYDVRSPFDAGEQADEGVTGDGTAYWTAASGPALGTKDWLLLIAATTPASGECIFATRDSGDGLSVAMASATVLRCVFDAGSAYNIDAPAAVAGQINTWAIAGDRSGNATAYLNTTAGTPVDISGDAATDVTDEDVLTLMADGAGANDCNGTLFAVALYQGAGMLGADTAAVVKQLTMRFAGLYGRTGPTEASLVPTVTRATAAGHSVTRSSVRKYWRLGSGLAVASDQGVPVYGAATNSCPFSEDCTNWSVGGPGGTQSDSGIDSPIVGTSWNRLVEVAGGDTFYVTTRAGATAPTQNQKFLCSVFLKNGDRGFATLRAYEAGGASFGVNVNLSTFAVTDANAAGNYTLHDSGVIEVGNGCYAWAVVSDSTASPAVPTFTVAISSQATMAQSVYDTFVGDPTSYPLGILWTGAMVVIGATGPQPYIPTAGAAATRNATVLEYPIAAVPFAGPFTIELPFTLPDHAPDATRVLFCISDETIDHYLSASVATNGSLDVDSLESGGDIGHVDLAGDYADGAEHVLRVAMGGGALMARVDHGAVSTDTAATLITAVDSFKIGCDYNDALYAQGHIDVGRMKIWKGVRL